MQGLSDQQLIKNYLKGDEKSLEILIKHYLKPIYYFSYRNVNNQQEAEDITQETFVKAWRNLKKFKTWIFTIAKNTAIDFLRKKKNIAFTDLENKDHENNFIESLADPSPLPLEIFERKQLSQTVARAIKKLSPLARITILLRYNEHFTFQEITQILNKPINTVKSWHYRAILRLKKILTKK